METFEFLSAYSVIGSSAGCMASIAKRNAGVV
jgi:hypothetical protein